MTTPGFFDTLEAQLGDGLEQHVRRRARRRRALERGAGLAVAVVVVFATVLFVNRRDVAEAGVDVEQSDGLVYVRLTDVEYRPGVIEDAAREAGLDVTVVALPTGPSLVGRFVSATESGDEAGRLKELNDDGRSFTGFVLPADYHGSLQLEVGRPAKAGELYDAATNAVSEGEPLACTGVLGAPASDAVAIVRDRDLDAAWTEQVGTTQQRVDERDLATRDDIVVLRAIATSRTTVNVVVGPADTPRPPIRLTPPATC